MESKPNEANSGIKSSHDHKIPILKLPQSDDIFIFLIFNEEKKSLELHFVNKKTKKEELFKIDNLPMEKCLKCNCELSIDNCFYSVSKDNIEFYCNKCKKDEKSFNKFPISEISSDNKSMIVAMNSFLENNKKSFSAEFINNMQNLINVTSNIIVLYEIYNSLPLFSEKALILKNYINRLKLYFNNFNDIRLENLYLFLKNILIASTTKKDESFLNYMSSYIIKNINHFNASQILIPVLEDIFEGNFLLFVIKNEIDKKKIKDDNAILSFKNDLNSLKLKINEKKILLMKKEMQIQSLKNKIIDFLQKYNYSYNYFSSKKVLERIFIDHILYVIFKYHHSRFQKINLDEFIITSIQKELNNIIKFLLTQNHNKDNESQINDLITKINQEINYLEGKRKKKRMEINLALIILQAKELY